MSEYGLKQGTPEIASVGALAFGPDDILFVADNMSATITAVNVADTSDGAAGPFELDDIDGRLASFLGCDRTDVGLRDMVVHPRTNNVYLSVMRGKGDDAVPVIVRIDGQAVMSEVSLTDVEFAQTTIDNAPSVDDERQDRRFGGPGEGVERDFGNGRKVWITSLPARMSTVTDMAYADGNVLVAGMSNEEFASNMRRLAFPFTQDKAEANLEIFHVSHGKWETASPIRSFVPTEEGKGILASYTCTPVVYFRPDDITGASKVTGRTVAELGAGNMPLDMISFTQGGDEHVLVANSTHPLMKFKTADASAQPGLTEPREPVGIPRETIDIPGITKLANLGGEYVLALQTNDDKRNLVSLKAESI